jgi:hypothetical protein
MPGFNIGDKSDATAQITSKVNYYYTYTWEITRLFDTSYTNQGSADPVIMLRDMTLPTFSTSVDKYLGASVDYKWAKSVSWDDVKLTWYDSEGMIDIIEGWRRSIWTDDDGLRPGAQYKKTSILSYFLPDYTSRVNWYLYNSWPTQIRSGELTYTNSDIKIVEATVAYDWASGVKSVDGR